MNKKSFFSGMAVGVLAVLLVLTVRTGIVAVRGYSNSSAKISENVEKKLGDLQHIVSRYYLNEADLEDGQLEDGVYKGFISALNDPYSVYYTKEETADVNQNMKGTYYGIGAQLMQNAETNVLTVSKCFEGSGAAESGLQPYDIITEVDGTDITGMDISSAVALIKGEEGTKVTLTVYRESEPEPLHITITRREIEIPTVEYEVLKDNIGYILLTEFDETSVSQFNKAYSTLMDQNVDGLIVDLRNNPGGLLSVVRELLGHFVPDDGMIVYTEDKYGHKEKLYAETSSLCSKPLVVLVNEYSASASEIFAGAVQDHGTGTILGTTTYGKGVMQQVIDLQDGTSVKVTVSKYFTPAGQDINGKGITPDVKAEQDEAVRYLSDVPYEQDTQLQAAVRQIKETAR